MRIFLAAPMTGWLNGRCTSTSTLKAFLDLLQKALRSAGHDVFSAHQLEEFGSRPRHESICTPFDFLEVRRADLVIAFPSRSGGVHTELGWASSMNKPILLLASGTESPLARGLGTLTQTSLFNVSTSFPEDAGEREQVVTEVLKELSEFRGVERPLHVAFVATAFGFGPTAKAVVIAQEFRRCYPKARLDFFGWGIDHDFALCAGVFDQVIRVNVDNSEAVADMVEHFDIYDEVLSIMNFLVAQEWNLQKARLHVVDSLAWMWPSPPLGVENATYYFIQKYLVQEKRLAEWGEDLPVIPVGPICRHLSSRPDRVMHGHRKLLVNFSGCANPFVDHAMYQEYAVTLIRWIAADVANTYDQIVVCVQRHIADSIRQKVTFPCAAEVGHLSPDAFEDQLASATCILTTPGITTTLESAALGKQPCFLLAHNYSQALLNEQNLNLYPEQPSMAFSCLGPEFLVPEALAEKEGVQLVVRLLKRALCEKADWLRSRIRRMLRFSADCDPIPMGEIGQRQIVSMICSPAPSMERHEM